MEAGKKLCSGVMGNVPRLGHMVRQACERKLWGQVSAVGEELGRSGSSRMCVVGEGESEKGNHSCPLLNAYYAWAMHERI